MSTDLDIYPFKKISVKDACINIEKYFTKLSGLQGADVRLMTKDAQSQSGFRRLDDNFIIDYYKDAWYDICECKYMAVRVDLLILEPQGEVQKPALYPSFLASISGIRLTERTQLFLEICSALGLAKAMGNECIFHAGDFSWLVGKHKTSPHTNYDEEMLRDGYVNEYDIPLKLVDALPDAEPVDTIEQAVSNFFKTYKFPY